MKWLNGFVFFLFCLLSISVGLTGCAHSDWRTADRSSAGIAPKPNQEPRAMVQIYAARAFNWRGYFAVHTWIATKEKHAENYTVYHVMGWRARRGLSAVAVSNDLPDRNWFGNEPSVILDLRGRPAEKAIVKIQEAVKDYPYPFSYRVFPGPNSNTFVSHVIRNVPELEVELPPHAIGKDWIDNGDLVGFSESGTGGQVSLFGLLGMTVGLAEGVEVNILGMSFGLDFLRPALKLPFVGRLGFSDDQVFVESE